MALDIEKVIDLTAYAGNPAPKVVSQLSIIHESSDGELVQYYIESVNHSQGDKKTYAIGVYDRESQSYSYNDYDEVTWEEPGQRICGNAIERLGVKANIGKMPRIAAFSDEIRDALRGPFSDDTLPGWLGRINSGKAGQAAALVAAFHPVVHVGVLAASRRVEVGQRALTPVSPTGIDIDVQIPVLVAEVVVETGKPLGRL